jgi:hypothetical protein
MPCALLNKTFGLVGKFFLTLLYIRHVGATGIGY